MKRYTRGLKTLDFFVQEDRLSKFDDQMKKLSRVTDWEILESPLQRRQKASVVKPPYNYVMMYKILILHRIYNVQ
jgi:hypothetical protein